MPLGDQDRADIESWIGRVDDSEIERLDISLGRLGAWYLVALEELRIDLGRKVRDAYSVSSDSDRVVHDKNVEWLQTQIANLVAYIESDDDISLSAVGERLVLAARGATSESSTLIPTTVANPRRG